MSGGMVLALLAAVLLVGANAFFVAAEFALVAARTARLEADATDGDRLSAHALAAVRDLQPQLAGAQLGITMASLGLGYVAEPAVAALIEPLIDWVVDVPTGVLHSISFAVALGIVVTVHVVAGEMVPKNLAIAEPERMARQLTPVMQVYIIAFNPLIKALNAISNGLVRLVGLTPVDEISTVLTVKEFHRLLAGALDEGVIEPAEHELLAGALEFRDHTAASLMVAASDMVSVPRADSVAAVESVIAASGHTRVPVWGSAADDVLGFVHAKDLLHLPAEARSEPVPTELVRRMMVVSPVTSARELMLEMRRCRVHIALVESKDHHEHHRRMLGMVTLEDVLEALVGDIYDETDEDG